MSKKNVIKQTVEFKAPASHVYEALTTAARFAEATGAPAEIDLKVGGAISLFGGMVTGTNKEIQKNRRLVQSWRAGNWDQNVVSTVTFDLSETNGVTTLNFEHRDYPKDLEEHLSEGWVSRYWNPIKDLLAK